MKQANQISPLSSSSQHVPMGFTPADKVVPAAARPPTTRAAITHIIFDMDSLLPGPALGIDERGGRLGPTSWGGDNFFLLPHQALGLGLLTHFFSRTAAGQQACVGRRLGTGDQQPRLFERNRTAALLLPSIAIGRLCASREGCGAGASAFCISSAAGAI
jgi:hypothetical protein